MGSEHDEKEHFLNASILFAYQLLSSYMHNYTHRKAKSKNYRIKSIYEISHHASHGKKLVSKVGGISRKSIRQTTVR